MSKYEHSGKNSKKSQPIGRTATDAKSSLGQLKESPTTERIASRLTEASTWSEELTVANPDNSGSLLRSFAGSSLVTNVLLLVIIVFLIAAAVVWLLFTCKRTTFNKNWKKNRKYNRVHDTEQPESLNEGESVYVIINSLWVGKLLYECLSKGLSPSLSILWD